MKYDPVKRSLGKVFNKSPYSRILFYKLLDLLLLRAWHIKREIKNFRKSAPAEINILDAGAGFGQYSYFVSTVFPKSTITAVDIKKEQVEDCNAFFNSIGRGSRVRFIESDLISYHETEKFHLALSVDVMEHIEDDVSVFKNIHKALLPEGILLISTPSDQGGSDVHHENGPSFIEEHVRDGYNMEDLISKLKSSGFSHVEAKYSYGTPGKLSWKLSMKIPITLLNASKILFILLPLYYTIAFPFCLILNYLDVNNFHKTGTGLIVKAIK